MAMTTLIGAETFKQKGAHVSYPHRSLRLAADNNIKIYYNIQEINNLSIYSHLSIAPGIYIHGSLVIER